MNQNDVYRRQVLEWLYKRNSSSTSRRGRKTGSRVLISDLKRGLKEAYALSGTSVMPALLYLIDKGWVAVEGEERTFKTPNGTTQNSKTEWYYITADGVELLEGKSALFARPDPFSGINITAISSTVQVGDGNIANDRFRDASEALSSLRASLVASTSLTEPEKLDVAADISALSAQLVKQDPDPSIVGKLWRAVEKVAVGIGLSTDAAVVSGLLHGMI